MLPVSGGTVGFQDLREDTEQNEKHMLGPSTSHQA